jgi:very-short-patch-repair endonuclease
MRRNPTDPEKRVWRILSNSQLAGFKFRRQAVIPPYIADFLCPSAKLIVEVDGDTHDQAKDRLRDHVLSRQGYRTVRVTNAEVMSNLAGVYEHVLAALTAPLPFRGGAGGGASPRATQPAETPHPNPVPGRSGPRPDLNRAGRGSPGTPEGEGLEKVEARKLLGISLEGSVE